MRPADKLKLWTGGFINLPGIRPPAYLRFVLALSALSLVFAVAYGAFSILGHFGGGGHVTSRPIVEAFILFVLPFMILYTISVNNPASRIVLVLYCATVFATIARSDIPYSELDRSWPIFLILMLIIFTLLWLYLAPQARAYYLMINHKPIPDDLQGAADDLLTPAIAPGWLRRLARIIEPFSSIALIIVAIFLVYAAFANMSLR